MYRSRDEAVAMNKPDATEAAHQAIRVIRAKFALGDFRDGPNGAFRAGNVPEKNEHYYSTAVYSGLSEIELDKLEDSLSFPIPEQTRAHIPGDFRAFLRIANGLRLFGLSINGMYWKSDPNVGAPVGLRTELLERPVQIPKLYFGFGSINGRWSSQGTLYLTQTGEVVLMERYTCAVGARWPNLCEFLGQEIPRLLRSFDPKGSLLPGGKHLPIENEEIWEALAERAQQKFRNIPTQ
jgi:hypothetical protein